MNEAELLEKIASMQSSIIFLYLAVFLVAGMGVFAVLTLQSDVGRQIKWKTESLDDRINWKTESLEQRIGWKIESLADRVERLEAQLRERPRG